MSKRDGARSGLERMGFGWVTYGGFSGPAGYPNSATVADIGFRGRPKSAYKSHLFNPIHTGGMAFELAETLAVQDGQFVVVPVEHDEQRPAAREARKAERQARKNTKERMERRVNNRAAKLRAKDPSLSEQESVKLASIQIAKLIQHLPQ